ncbi:Protein of unknown function [Gryllus bimaculatus]|nr:Protein of unknown function [Gryllus bimaculatus]
MCDISIPREIRERCEELQLSDEQLREIMKRLLDNIERGLARDTHAASIVKKRQVHGSGFRWNKLQSSSDRIG